MRHEWNRRDDSIPSRIAAGIGNAFAVALLLTTAVGYLVVVAAVIKAAWRYLTTGGI
ncbi:MAG: hypothetical protein IPM64_17690 [Phycisphaerales bacterium]|nr:hypothetical protein [Phycisphaerales bacterium]